MVNINNEKAVTKVLAAILLLILLCVFAQIIMTGGADEEFYKICSEQRSGGGVIGGMIGSGGGSGGSSFVSGYTGCDAIIEATGLPSGQPFHYSGYFFTKGVMRAGFEEMPSFNGSSKTKYGNIGNGYPRITLLDMVMTCKRKIGNSIAKYSLLVLMISY